MQKYWTFREQIITYWFVRRSIFWVLQRELCFVN